MTKKARFIYLTIGIVAGLLLTACAGVVSGRVDLTKPGNFLFFGPTVGIAPEQSAPIEVEPSQDIELLRLERGFQPVVQPAVNPPTQEELEPLEVLPAQKPAEAVTQAQEQIKVQTTITHFCER